MESDAVNAGNVFLAREAIDQLEFAKQAQRSLSLKSDD
jgi:hypothetical protein